MSNELKELHKNPEYRNLIKLIAEKADGRLEIPIDLATKWLVDSESNMTYPEAGVVVKRYFKKMEALAYGTYKIGRWTEKSKFTFKQPVRKVLDIAQGVEGEPPSVMLKREGVEQQALSSVVHKLSPIRPTMDDVRRPDVRIVEYEIRPNFKASIRVPVDLTEAEAEKLSRLVNLIPY